MTPNTYCSAGNRPDTLHAAAADPVFQINSFDAHFQTQKVYKKQKYDTNYSQISHEKTILVERIKCISSL